jgi:hypothetical protein
MTYAPPVSGALPCGPAPDGNDTRFWEGLREGRLLLPRCAACDQWRSPGRTLCSACWSFDVSWLEVQAGGTVYTWIRTHRDFMSELDVSAPYVTALVELDDAPVRLLGILSGSGSVAIGDRVRGVFQQPPDAAWPVLRWEAA